MSETERDGGTKQRISRLKKSKVEQESLLRKIIRVKRPISYLSVLQNERDKLE